MGYELIRKSGSSGRKETHTENLDFDYKILVFKQIDRINLARTQNDFLTFCNGIDQLADFLEPYSVDSEMYQKKFREITKEYDKDMLGATKANGKEKSSTVNRYRKLFRALMLLIHENDLLPESVGEYND